MNQETQLTEHFQTRPFSKQGNYFQSKKPQEMKLILKNPQEMNLILKSGNRREIRMFFASLPCSIMKRRFSSQMKILTFNLTKEERASNSGVSLQREILKMAEVLEKLIMYKNL